MECPNLPTRRTRANRLNALKSTGPRTAAGKRRVALNGLRRGLCPEPLEREMLARGESPKHFCRLHRDLIALLGPREERGRQAVFALARLWWEKSRRLRAAGRWTVLGCADLDRQIDYLLALSLLAQQCSENWELVELRWALGGEFHKVRRARETVERWLLAGRGRRYPSKARQSQYD